MRLPPRLRTRLLAAALGLAPLLACASGDARDDRPIVFVSVLPQKFAVDRIAGDLVRVEVMIPPGASPITHEPSLRQLQLLQEADLYVKVGHPGFPFEAAWLERILASVPELAVVDGSAGIEGAAGDPHVWVAPRHMERLAIAIEAALEEILPDERERLRANLAGFRREIDDLDREIRKALEGKRGREFLVFHPAWGHFAAAYGLEQVAIERDGKEPDARALSKRIAQARERGVRVVFVQPQLDPSAARTLAAEIDARVEVLDPLAYDWPDNLRRVTRALAEALAD